jgi:CubicO group peptidase (beta-lactamase class C family)
MSQKLTGAGLVRLQEVAERQVADGTVPGLVVLVASGDEVDLQAFGDMAIGGAPMTADSLFRIASMTKPVTGAATMVLTQEGLIGLDEPVDRLLPELADRRVLRRVDGPLDDTVPAERAITTRDLLTFTFGFGIVTEMFMTAEPWPVQKAVGELGIAAALGAPDPEHQPGPDAWIAGLGSLPLLAQPGERWMYNTGACVLGVLLARAAGLPFAEVLRTRIFEPLGMAETAFWTPEPERLATAYQPRPAGLVVADPPEGAWSRQPAFEDGAAGLVSTAADMLAFARMFLRGGGSVLSAESVRAMTTDQLTPEQKALGGLGPGFFDTQSWGYCQAVRNNGAFGWAGGYGTTWLVDPGRDLVVIVMTQRQFETAGGPDFHREIQDAAYAALA